MTKPGLPLKFLETALRYEGDDCVVWPFATTKRGYAKLFVDGRLELASRVMCGLKNGPAPTGKHEAAHSCGKGHLGCISPNHLQWKTKIENERDKVAHGTLLKPSAKLTPAIVEMVRSSTLQGTQLARLIGVNKSTISVIRNHKTWKAAA